TIPRGHGGLHPPHGMRQPHAPTVHPVVPPPFFFPKLIAIKSQCRTLTVKIRHPDRFPARCLSPVFFSEPPARPLALAGATVCQEACHASHRSAQGAEYSPHLASGLSALLPCRRRLRAVRGAAVDPRLERLSRRLATGGRLAGLAPSRDGVRLCHR